MKVWNFLCGRCERALKKRSGEVYCCVSLGNSFPLSEPQFLHLKLRKDGDGPNQGFQTSTIYPAPVWVCHVGPPASLYMEYFPPHGLTLKRKLHIALGRVPLSRREAVQAWRTWDQCLLAESSEVSIPAWRRWSLGLVNSTCHLYPNPDSDKTYPHGSGPVMETLQAQLPWALGSVVVVYPPQTAEEKPALFHLKISNHVSPLCLHFEGT